MGGDPRDALARYEQRLAGFFAKKQDAAARFAGSFAPRSRLAVALRNGASRLLVIPLFARLAFSASLRDAIELPDYG
jgi:2-polyprenyl-6-methoxyphenol hydroxylase-like FAD-dependent oxidoreductase